jgi:hypothetical protein
VSKELRYFTTVHSKYGGPTRNEADNFQDQSNSRSIYCYVTTLGRIMKTQDYHPAFDVLLDCLSNGDTKTKEKIEKYAAHRKVFGREAAKRIYPEVHYIQISDPLLKDVWNNLLKTIDKL